MPDGCQAGSAKRVTRDNSAQKSGEIVHKKFKAGLVMQLKMLAVDVIAEEGEMIPVCGSDLVDLYDELCLILNGMENMDGRLIWTPSGHTTRLMDAARWLGSDGSGGGAFTSVVTTPENDVFTSVEFALLSPFPYAMNYPQSMPNSLSPSTPTTFTNTGNTDFYPVLQVHGGADPSFVVHNNTTGLLLSYSSSLPGAPPVGSSSYIEFDFFRDTAYVDGDQRNAKPGIDILTSDFWPIVPGANILEYDGTGTVTVLWQPAYTG